MGKGKVSIRGRDRKREREEQRGGKRGKIGREK